MIEGMVILSLALFFDGYMIYISYKSDSEDMTTRLSGRVRVELFECDICTRVYIMALPESESSIACPNCERINQLV